MWSSGRFRSVSPGKAASIKKTRQCWKKDKRQTISWQKLNLKLMFKYALTLVIIFSRISLGIMAKNMFQKKNIPYLSQKLWVILCITVLENLQWEINLIPKIYLNFWLYILIAPDELNAAKWAIQFWNYSKPANISTEHGPVGLNRTLCSLNFWFVFIEFFNLNSFNAVTWCWYSCNKAIILSRKFELPNGAAGFIDFKYKLKIYRTPLKRSYLVQII